MLVRMYSPLTYERLSIFFGGGISEGIAMGIGAAFEIRRAHRQWGRVVEQRGWLLPGQARQERALLETLHLKLRALSDAVDYARTIVRTLRRCLMERG